MKEHLAAERKGPYLGLAVAVLFAAWRATTSDWLGVALGVIGGAFACVELSTAAWAARYRRAAIIALTIAFGALFIWTVMRRFDASHMP